MIKHNVPDTQSIIQQISDILLINGGFLSNPGLYTGEMGLVLFVTRYAHFTQNELYYNYAHSLIEKIQNRIHNDTPLNYKQGLTGIGSVIEYLTQNGLLEADTDEVLEDFDKRIFFTYNISYLPADVIMDVGYYTIWRMSGNSSQGNKMRRTIVPSIIDAMKKLCMNKDIALFEKIFTLPDHSVMTEWYKLCLKIIPNGYWEQVEDYYSKQITNRDLFDKVNIHLGLQNGLAGCGISLLTRFDRDNSWISLFPNNFYTINNESISI